MKTSIKTLQDVGGLSELRTYTGAVRKSAKPELPTTAILSLYMRGNERGRIVSELKRLKKRKIQLNKRLKDVEKEIAKSFKSATKMAEELKGAPVKNAGERTEKNLKERMVLSY